MKLLLKQSRRAISLALTLLLVLTLVPAVPAYAASVAIDEANFPDKVFRDYVETNFDTYKDGLLSEAELEAVTSIGLENSGVADFKGVEHFKNLSKFWCDRNRLTTLNVTKNTALKGLYCYDNNLTELDVTKNTELEVLSCYNNNLTELDVTKNTALKGLYCGDNNLTGLDVTKNTALKYLYCDDNNLTGLDVTKNTELEYLDCYNNNLTGLDVTKNTELKYLDCSDNQLSTLNVSNNTALTELRCSNNQLTTLDVTKNTELKYLYCERNQLTSLDLSKNTKIISSSTVNEQVLFVALTGGKLNFSDLPAGFDKTKVSDITGGSIDGEAFSFTGDTLTYKYDTGLTVGGTKIYLDTTLNQATVYNITVSSSAGGMLGSDKSKAAKGETVNLTVTPYSGYRFKSWEKTPASLDIKSDNTFIMPDENVTIKAIFEKKPVTPPSGGGGGGIVLPPAVENEEVKAAKEAAAKAVTELLKAETFSGEEQKKSEEIKKSFDDKLAKAATVDEVKKLQEETVAAINALWSDGEISLKAKVEAIGRTDLIAKSKVVKTKSGAKAVRISWNKVEGLDFDGYEIYRSTSRTKFGNTPFKTAEGAKTSYLNTKNLRKGKTYYYKLKAFKMINGEKVYTDFSTRTWKTPKK